MFNSWNLNCSPAFYGVFCIRKIIRQIRKSNESKKPQNPKKSRQKPLGFRMNVYVW